MIVSLNVILSYAIENRGFFPNVIIIIGKHVRKFIGRTQKSLLWRLPIQLFFAQRLEHIVPQWHAGPPARKFRTQWRIGMMQFRKRDQSYERKHNYTHTMELTHALSGSCGSNRTPAEMSHRWTHRFSAARNTSNEIDFTHISHMHRTNSMNKSTHTQLSTERLIYHRKRIQLLELIHGRHVRFDRLHIQLDLMVPFSFRRRLIVHPSEPTRAFCKMNAITDGRLIGTINDHSHQRRRHNVHECSVCVRRQPATLLSIEQRTRRTMQCSSHRGKWSRI